MKRDPHISKLIRESGVVQAPGNFTSSVMDKIHALPEKRSYKPLIGRGARILIIFFLIALVVIAILYTEPSGELFGVPVKSAAVARQWPQLHFNLDFLKQMNVSTGLASALLALFVLVLSDAGLSRRKYSHRHGHRLT